MVRVLTLLLAAAVVVAGCQTGPFGKKDAGPVVEDAEATDSEAPVLLEEPGLKNALDRRFDDIPLPQGAKPDLERSYVYESKTLQVGRMVYKTRHSLSELAQFYIRECPESDWELESVLQVSGYELQYRKPGKRLLVSIRRLGFGRGRLLSLNLTPEGL